MSGISRLNRFVGLFLLVAAAVIFASCAWIGVGSKSEIVDYGLYDAKVATRGNAVVSASGITHLQSTLDIPAEPGRYFGLQVQVTNPRKDNTSVCRFQVDHPAFAAPGGQPTAQFAHEFALEPNEVSTQQFIWYFVKQAGYEIVPGKWTMRVFVNNREIAKKQFVVR
ncbi:MAG TPA: DUF3859 domain-containing protein [Chthoniobacterales bacterium]